MIPDFVSRAKHICHMKCSNHQATETWHLKVNQTQIIPDLNFFFFNILKYFITAKTYFVK